MRPALLVLVVLALLVAACGGGTGGGPGGPAASAAPVFWPLRGTQAPNADAIKRRPVVVKVANDPAARPQSGLAQADLVLEIPVEGGITRYALVFHSEDAARIGPVRSARQSDLNYIPALKAILVHVGASESVTKLVRDAAKNGSFVDVDEFTHAGAFERLTTKPAPYNAYTSTARARDAGAAAAADKVSVPTFEFSASPKSEGVAGTALAIPYLASGRVTYAFDASAGGYRRTQDGKPTIDEDTKREVLPDNVIVIKTEVSQIPGTADSTGAPSVDFRATGTGTVVVLRDGKRFDGTWSRQASDFYRFADASGAPIPLKPGRTWIHIVPDDFQLS